MHEREYNKLSKSIEEEYHKKLDALDLVYKMAGGNTQNGRSPRTSGRGAQIKQAVMGVLPGMNGEFNQRDIESKITASFPDIAVGLKRSSLSVALKRIAESGKIQIVEAGKGKRPTKYRFGK